ncbi:MAG: alkaline shock response membrane anchor protein AmaP [Candidatus Tantalella remota]|nr:alkaline shock response membrane anchor protein AmaP [Candidatus Tantalella remota]
MNFIKKICLIVYLIIMVCVGGLLVVLSLNIAPAETWIDAINLIYSSVHTQIAAGVVGLMFIVVGVVGPYKGARKLNRSKIITFQNPDGEVTVALSAIENFVLRVAKDIPGIKDVKSRVEVNKKGINITSFVSIEAGTNIPEATEQIQMMVKARVQDMLGVEENINMKMHISKIMKGSQGAAVQEEDAPAGSHVPFREME